VGEAHVEQRVTCRRCQFWLRVEVAPGDDWRVEALCPSCATWACFTAADTQDPPRADPAELDAEAQRLGELLRRPIHECCGHPAVAWLDRVGKGVFRDDSGPICWPALHCAYRFTRGGSGAYIWQEDGSWYVRSRHPLRGRGSPPEPVEVFLFEAALDRLLE
jgi:hypothetical protein